MSHARVLAFIDFYQTENQRPPAVRDIVAALDWNSLHYVQVVIRSLIQKGFLVRDPAEGMHTTCRTLRILKWRSGECVLIRGQWYRLTRE